MNVSLDVQIAEKKGINIFDGVPFWLYDMNKAFELVDEIIDECWQFDLLHSNRWCVELDNLTETFYAYGDTPQEAICKAYLEWCELKGKE